MQQYVDHIELFIFTSDGRRLKFVGWCELVEVNNIEPVHSLMLVKVHDAVIDDLLSGEAVAQLHLGDTIEVYAQVRRSHAGIPHKMIANGEWKGYYIAERVIERVLPDTKPTPPDNDWVDAPG